jgi:hypothetical protein
MMRRIIIINRSSRSHFFIMDNRLVIRKVRFGFKAEIGHSFSINGDGVTNYWNSTFNLTIGSSVFTVTFFE